MNKPSENLIYKNVKQIIKHAIKISNFNALTSIEIQNYVKLNYITKSNTKIPLYSIVKKILRKSSVFVKIGKNKEKGYLWTLKEKRMDFKMIKSYKNDGHSNAYLENFIAENCEDNHLKPLTYQGKFIELPSLKDKEKYETNNELFNTIYYKKIITDYKFNSNDLFEFNRGVGDYLKHYFSFQKQYFDIKLDSLKGKINANSLKDIFKTNDLSNIYNEMDYDYEEINEMIFKKMHERYKKLFNNK